MPLYIPTSPNLFTEREFRAYFHNILEELDQAPFSAIQREKLSGVMLNNYLDQRTREFFFYHFSGLVEVAIQTFFARCEHPTILELGCGSGSISILLALLGAKVIALDFDSELIAACEIRRELYEAQVGPLALNFVCHDALSFPFDKVASLDGIYSLFAFNTMQPSERLLSACLPALKPGGTFLVSDGNRLNLYNRLFRRRAVLSPFQIRDLLAVPSWRVTLEFSCMIPPAAVRISPLFRLGSLCAAAARNLGCEPWLSNSYTIAAQRCL